MLRTRKIESIILLVLCLFSVGSFALANEWIPFGPSLKHRNPTACVLVSNSQETIIEFTLHGMETKNIDDNNETFQILNFPDYYTTQDVGKPQLPVTADLVGIPDLSNVQVSVIETEEVVLDGSFNVYPRQIPRREIDDYLFVIDQDFYQVNAYYPVENVWISEPRIWRDARIVTLKTFPVKYNPATGRVKILRRIVVRLEYAGTSTENTFTGPRNPIKKEWDRLYSRTILNYDYLGYVKEDNTLGKVTGIPGYDYLIITRDDYYDSILPLAHWKTRKGLNCDIVSFSYKPTQAEIRTAILGYDNLSYVLLVGHHNKLPFALGVDIDEFGQSCDWYGDFWYADLEGTFPSEPELAIGRIVAESVADVDIMVQKILDYELKPPLTYVGSDMWVNRSLLVAHYADYYLDSRENPHPLTETYEQCKNSIISNHTNDFEYVKVYGSTQGISNAHIDTAINNGVGLVNYRGHGDAYHGWTQWNEYNYYRKDEAYGLTNGTLTPVVLSIACNTADLTVPGTETLAEGFCRNASGGAVAFLGATDYTRTYTNHTYDKKLYNAICDIDTVTRIGDISDYAVIEILNGCGEPGAFNAKRYYWLGEPSMELWTDAINEFTGVTFNDDKTNITVNSPVSCDIWVYDGVNDPYVYEDVTSKTFSPQYRPAYVTLVKEGYKPCTAVSQGTFTTDQYWFGDMRVIGSIKVEDNTTLHILPGTTVQLDGYHNFAIKTGSKVDARGTEEAPITFTSATGTTRQSWGCIYVYTNDNYFEHCVFEYGKWPILFDALSGTLSGNVVENCEFFQNDQGIRIHENDMLVKECEFHHNRIGVVTYWNTSATFRQNMIYNNDRDGVYSYGNNAIRFKQNVIEQNGHVSSGYGFVSYSSDNAYFGIVDDTDYQGYNTIRRNGNIEVMAYYGFTNLMLGFCTVHETIYAYNAIYDDTYGNYEAYNTSGNPPIFANKCWWGSDGPYKYGLVYASYPLPTEPPWVGTTNGPMGKASVVSYQSTPENSTEDLILQLKTTIQNNPNSTEAQEALLMLNGIIMGDFTENRYGEKSSFYGYLTGLYNSHRNIRLGEIALDKMVHWKIAEGDYMEALALTLEAQTVMEGDLKVDALLNEVLLYISMSDVQKARSSLDRCKSKYTIDARQLEFVEEYLTNVEEQIEEGIIEAYSVGKPFSQPDADDESAPEQFGLSQNFPNPGNPTTSIQFLLPESGHVMLKITNLMGQEVKTLMDESKQAGSYSVVWDGKDSNGVEMPSGIYIYTLHVGDKVFTRKLTLMK